MMAARLANLQNGQHPTSANLQSIGVSRAEAAALVKVSERAEH